MIGRKINDTTVVLARHETKSCQRADDSVFCAGESFQVNAICGCESQCFRLRQQLAFRAVAPIGDSGGDRISDGKSRIAADGDPSEDQCAEAGGESGDSNRSAAFELYRGATVLSGAGDSRILEELMANDETAVEFVGKLANQVARELVGAGRVERIRVVETDGDHVAVPIMRHGRRGIGTRVWR